MSQYVARFELTIESDEQIVSRLSEVTGRGETADDAMDWLRCTAP